MSIEVVSNSTVAAPAAERAAVETNPAPAAQAEQNVSAESGTAETEAKNESEEGTEAEGDEPEAKDDEKEKPKKKGGWQRQIDRKTKEAAEAKREAEYWRAEALKHAGAKEQATPERHDEPAVGDGEPSPDDFSTHAEYLKAVARWSANQVHKEHSQKAEKSRLETEQASVLKAHHDREAAFAQKTKDYAEALEDVDSFKDVSATLGGLIVSSENGPEIMYALAKDPAEYERINALPPIAAARALGKLEAKIAAQASDEAKPQTKTLTSAPKPLTPVGSKGGAAERTLADAASMSQAEYEAMRRKQIAARRAAW